MSDTPETEAAILASEGQWSFVLRECCEKLERERNQLREIVQQYLLADAEIHKKAQELLVKAQILKEERNQQEAIEKAMEEANK